MLVGSIGVICHDVMRRISHTLQFLIINLHFVEKAKLLVWGDFFQSLFASFVALLILNYYYVI